MGLTRRLDRSTWAVGLALTCALALPASADAAWNQPIGGVSPINVSSIQDGSSPSIADVGGTPYVAWDEPDGTNREIRVSRLNAAGTAWEQVVGGASPINADPTRDASGASIANVGGVPHVAWSETDGTNFEIRVARLNGAGTDWDELEGGASPINQGATRNAAEPSLTSIDGVPYVAWREFDGVNTEIRVSRFNGATWDQVNPAAAASPINESNIRDANDPSLVGVEGVPYVAWSETDGTNREIRVSRLNEAGTAWVQVVGGASPINQSPTQAPGANEPSLTEIGGVPWVAWNENDATNDEVRVSRLNGDGTDWEQVVGGPSPINESPTRGGADPSLTEIGGVPWIAWFESDGVNFEMRASRLNGSGTAWEQPVAGASPINQSPTGAPLWPSLTAVDGVPFLAWSEFDGTNFEVRVSRLEPEFLNLSAIPTDTGATLLTEVRNFGLPHRIGFQFGSPGFGTQTPTMAASTADNEDVVTRQVSGLTPNTTYDLRPYALAGTAAPLVLGGAGQFKTAAQNGPGPQGSTGQTGASGPTGPAAGPQDFKLLVAILSVSRSKPRGVSLSYLATAGSSVTLEIERRSGSGARKSQILKTVTAKAKLGRNRIRWSGEIGGKAASPGRYTLRLRATSADGQKAKDTIRVTVPKPKSLTDQDRRARRDVRRDPADRTVVDPDAAVRGRATERVQEAGASPPMNGDAAVRARVLLQHVRQDRQRQDPGPDEPPR